MVDEEDVMMCIDSYTQVVKLLVDCVHLLTSCFLSSSCRSPRKFQELDPRFWHKIQVRGPAEPRTEPSGEKPPHP